MTVVVLEGCLGDWSKKSYIEKLAEKARQGSIELYAVDTRDIRKGEDKDKLYEPPVHFINKKSDTTYDTIEADFVFIVTPHEFHCKIADHWLKEKKLRKNGIIFIEKPLDSSVEEVEKLKKKFKEELEKKITAIDHYIQKILPIAKELEKNKGKYGKIKKIKLHILESDPILESRKKTLDEGLILDIFPHVLAVFTKIMKSYYSDFTLDAEKFEIVDVKTGTYEGAPIAGETFAGIVAKTGGIEIESFIGKAVDFGDRKTLEILFEKGSKKAVFASGDDIGSLLDDIFKNRCDQNECAKFLRFSEGFEIVKIISKIREKASEPVKYEKFDTLDEILMKGGEHEEGSDKFCGGCNET